MNIVYIGSSGFLSVIPLRFLLLSGDRPVAVAVDATTSVSLAELETPIIAGSNESVEMLAGMNRIPVINLHQADASSVEEIKSYKPDVIIVSCLAMKLPDEILAIPKYGCFNLHPSLLPAFRGPVPLFWQFRQGVDCFGMSLHRVTSDIDAGPVISRQTVTMPDGVSNDEANMLFAETAVHLLESLLHKLEDAEVIVETTQNEADATSMGYPDKMDFEVSTAWPARRIYNFMRATRHWEQTYRCKVVGQCYELTEALDFQNTAMTIEGPVIAGDIITIPCSHSVLTAHYQST